jgi:RimJ/RimL family protein N-acetyltransferase
LDSASTKLKDGRSVLIREFRREDKEKFIEMYEGLSAETVRWAMPPYNRERLEKGWLSNSQNLISIVAFHDDKIVGHAQIFKFPNPRLRATGDLVVYLHQDFHNVGLGSAMLSKLIDLAKKDGMHRIGLTVVRDNKPAIHLYRKFGFKTEGVKRDAYFGEDGKYHDELVMGLILANSTSPSQAF